MNNIYHNIHTDGEDPDKGYKTGEGGCSYVIVTFDNDPGDYSISDFSDIYAGVNDTCALSVNVPTRSPSVSPSASSHTPTILHSPSLQPSPQPSFQPSLQPWSYLSTTTIATSTTTTETANTAGIRPTAGNTVNDEKNDNSNTIGLEIWVIILLILVILLCTILGIVLFYTYNEKRIRDKKNSFEQQAQSQTSKHIHNNGNGTYMAKTQTASPSDNVSTNYTHKMLTTPAHLTMQSIVASRSSENEDSSYPGGRDEVDPMGKFGSISSAPDMDTSATGERDSINFHSAGKYKMSHEITATGTAITVDTINNINDDGVFTPHIQMDGDFVEYELNSRRNSNGNINTDGGKNAGEKENNENNENIIGNKNDNVDIINIGGVLELEERHVSLQIEGPNKVKYVELKQETGLDINVWQKWKVDDVIKWIKFELKDSNVDNEMIESFCNEMKQHQISGNLLNLFQKNDQMYQEFKNSFKIKSFGIWAVVAVSIANLPNQMK